MRARIWALLSLAVAFIPARAQCAEHTGGSSPRVFIIQSYHPGLAWTEGVSAGIREVFDASGLDVEIQSEYLDARRYPEPGFLEQESALVERKMEKFHPDLVIASDNAALTFAIARRAGSLRGVPIVFCGINSFRPSMLGGEKNVTGVPEEVSVADTVSLALRLHPGARRLVVIGRTAVAADAANREAFVEALPALPARTSTEYWDDLPASELRARLLPLGWDSIVFVNGLMAEENGRELMYDQTTAFIRQFCSAPLYSLWDVYLGYGIVGGKLVSGRKQGEMAASIAVRVLKGEPVDSIPVAGAQEANQYMFDMRELRRFRIPRSSLPPGSLLVNDSLAPLLRYWWLILIVGIFVVMETMVIAGLVAAVRQLGVTQKRLLANEQRLALALSGADLGTWDLEIQSGAATFNDRWMEMLGYGPGELEQHQRTWRALVHPDDRARVEATLSRHLTGETTAYEVEHRLRHKSGSWVWVLSKGRVIERDEKGGPLRACGTHLDITQRKLAEEKRLELERQLLHAQKLESLGLLAGGIAHDFNNLLTAILGNLDLVENDLPITSEARACVSSAMSAARKAADLAHQMLAYSGKGRFVNRLVDLNAFITDMAGLLKTSIPKTVSLDLRMDPIPPIVTADPAQLQQVVLNLITNAAEAIGGSPGTISIVTGSIECDADYLAGSFLEEKPGAGRFVFMEITDTGCGMDDETRRRLFEPYFSKKGPGRGLGMSAVLGIVKGHHGAIMIDSRVGSGTSVRVLLPAVDAAAYEATVGAASDPIDEVGTLPLAGFALVVDDEEPIRMLARKALERIGLRVEITSDSEEALAFFRAHAQEISLVLLDFTLPKMDGAAVFYEMKAIRNDVKVILSSGYNQQDVTQRLAGSGLAGFVQKPYHVADLQREVRRVLHVA